MRVRGILAIMLTAEDKKWLEGNFATKKEIGAVRDGLDILRHNFNTSSIEKYNLKSEIEAIRASNIRIEEMSKMLGIAEGNTGRIADLEQENLAGAETLRRHGRQLEQLAGVAKVKLAD